MVDRIAASGIESREEKDAGCKDCLEGRLAWVLKEWIDLRWRRRELEESCEISMRQNVKIWM